MPPPKTKAIRKSLVYVDAGEAFFTIAWYSFFVTVKITLLSNKIPNMYFCRKEGKYSAVHSALMAAGKKIPAENRRG